MEALEIADKCVRIAKSCCHNEQVDVAKNFFNRAITKLEASDVPGKMEAIDIIITAWNKLLNDREQGVLGTGFEHIDSQTILN